MPILTLVGTGDKLLIGTGNPVLAKLLRLRAEFRSGRGAAR